jgi:hypothetical protein
MIANPQKKPKASPKASGKGGAKVGAGHSKPSLTKRTLEIAELLASQGITPLEVMMKVMHELYEEAENCKNQDGEPQANIEAQEKRIKLLNMVAVVGKHAAPYMHPRLSAIEHTGKDGTPLQSGVLVVPTTMSADEWELAAQSKH